MPENIDHQLVSLRTRVDEARKPKPEAPTGLAAFAIALSKWGEGIAAKKKAEPHKGF